MEVLSTVTEWLIIGIVAVVGFMFRRLFTHDEKLGTHNTQLALLEQQSERQETFYATEVSRREKQRTEIYSMINKQHREIMRAITALQEK